MLANQATVYKYHRQLKQEQQREQKEANRVFNEGQQLVKESNNLAKNVSQVASALSKLASTKAKVAPAKSKLTAAKQQYSKAKLHTQQCKSTLRQKTVAYKQSASTYSQRQRAADMAWAKVESVRASAACATEDTASRLAAAVQSAVANARAASAAANEARSRMVAARHEMERAQSDLDSAQRREAEALSQQHRAEQDLASVERAVVEVEGELASAKQAVEQAKQALERAKQALQQAKQALEQAKLAVQQALQELEEAKVRFEEAKRKAEEAKKQAEEAKRKAEEAKQKEEEAKQKDCEEKQRQLEKETKEAEREAAAKEQAAEEATREQEKALQEQQLLEVKLAAERQKLAENEAATRQAQEVEKIAQLALDDLIESELEKRMANLRVSDEVKESPKRQLTEEQKAKKARMLKSAEGKLNLKSIEAKLEEGEDLTSAEHRYLSKTKKYRDPDRKFKASEDGKMKVEMAKSNERMRELLNDKQRELLEKQTLKTKEKLLDEIRRVDRTSSAEEIESFREGDKLMRQYDANGGPGKISARTAMDAMAKKSLGVPKAVDQQGKEKNHFIPNELLTDTANSLIEDDNYEDAISVLEFGGSKLNFSENGSYFNRKGQKDANGDPVVLKEGEITDADAERALFRAGFEDQHVQHKGTQIVDAMGGLVEKIESGEVTSGAMAALMVEMGKYQGWNDVLGMVLDNHKVKIRDDVADDFEKLMENMIMETVD